MHSGLERQTADYSGTELRNILIAKHQSSRNCVNLEDERRICSVAGIWLRSVPECIPTQTKSFFELIPGGTSEEVKGRQHG
jgi:hypothetical protein